MTRSIPLTNGMVTLVDDWNYEWLSQYRWHHADGYAIRSVKINGKWTTARMHRMILGAQPDQQCDHRNHNGLDNREENLRLCTPSQNQMNARRRTDGTSRFKGVCWNGQRRKWQMALRVPGRPSYRGLFDDEEDAARAYDRAAFERDPEFAFLNFPMEGV